MVVYESMRAWVICVLIQLSFKLITVFTHLFLGKTEAFPAQWSSLTRTCYNYDLTISIKPTSLISMQFALENEIKMNK